MNVDAQYLPIRESLLIHNWLFVNLAIVPIVPLPHRYKCCMSEPLAGPAFVAEGLSGQSIIINDWVERAGTAVASHHDRRNRTDSFEHRFFDLALLQLKPLRAYVYINSS
jgi:hypothetical protein